MQFHTQCFVCDGCKKPLERSFQHKKERLYHPACYQRMFGLRCQHCRDVIEGSYVKDAAGPYHEACYQTLHDLQCALCNQAITGSYLQDPWHRKAHPEHAQGVTVQCHVCARLCRADQAKSLADQRQVCEICQDTEVVTPAHIQQAKHAVLKHLKAVGFVYIPDYVKVEMYAEQALINERMRASATGNIHGYTRTAQRHIPQYGLILEHSIHVLNGMPRLAFMGVLAHELLHVWIHEQGLKHLTPPQVEGFCNLATALMYTQAVSPEDQALSTVLLQRLHEDPDPVYGEGYRLMASHLKRLGWPGLLEAMGQPGALDEAPEISQKTSEKNFEETAPPEVAELETRRPVKELVKPTPRRTASNAEDSAQRLAEIKARVKAQMDQVRANSTLAPKAKPAQKGLKKLGKKKRI